MDWLTMSNIIKFNDKHEEAKRTNIPTAEHESVMKEKDKHPIQVAFERRKPDLDPQLIWRGKDSANWSDLVVNAPPLYIQEKVHPKVLINDLKNRTQARQEETQLDLFADFNGLPKDATATEFYQHQANWTNRMILGDNLQVMASLAEREGLRGRVQCIYLDPPYGIKFNSNFQWSTTSRDVKDGKLDHITREPEQVKAFRDTWRDGIHSYLTYLRDRLTVARDLLSESGSIFVQIGDENVHRVRAVMDEVFESENFCQQIPFRKKLMPLGANLLEGMCDYILWSAKNIEHVKFHHLYRLTEPSVSSRWTNVELLNGTRRKITRIEGNNLSSLPSNSKVYRLVSQRKPEYYEANDYMFDFQNKKIKPPRGGCWILTEDKMNRIALSNRLEVEGDNLSYVYYHNDFPYSKFTNFWTDTSPVQGKEYVVQTSNGVIQRCIQMTTDPGDLVLDPTCGSGTTAYVAEQWGRRWITIDTSRVALALARARIMGARYPYYLLADSETGQKKEAEITRTLPKETKTYNNIRQGFVYERVPHITLKSIANNTEIDVIWDKFQPQVQEALDQLNAALKGHKTPYKVTTGGREGKLIQFDSPGTVKLPSGEEAPANALLDWEAPREAPGDWPDSTHKPLEQFWKARIARQKEIDASIAAKADQEFLYDKPYEANNIVRVAGPFTVESLSPHRVLVVDQDDNLVDPSQKSDRSAEETNFVDVILETLKVAGVQQAHKENKIDFTALTGFPGKYICAEGTYLEGDTERRAGVFIGPEFGTVGRADLVAAARESGDLRFDVLISCAFSYDAHSADFIQLGRIPVLKARMNADLHMATDLKDTKTANLFCIFGEPDIDILSTEDDRLQVKIHGVDVFHPGTGEVRSSNADEIACWFIDTDYNEESFFVRHAYFLGANDPYKSLKTTLKAEIDEEAWSTLHSDTSRPFNKPKSGRIAVKVINHLGDEVMKVFSA